MKAGPRARFLAQLAKKWSADETSRRAAALALYTFLALAPLLFVMVSIVGLIYGKAGAQADIIAQVRDVAGPTSASALQTILENVGSSTTGILGAIGGTLLLVAGAAGVFSELQTALKVIWGSRDRPQRGLLGRLNLLDRLLTFGALLGVGLLLVVSLAATTLVAKFAHELSDVLPAPTLILHIADFFLFLGIVTILTVFLFKVLPRVKTGWGDIWLGALVTAFLFSIGKFAVGMYLGRSGASSSYGAAAGFVVLLLWIYYSAQIFLLGAQIFLLGAQFTALRGSRRLTRADSLGPAPATDRPAAESSAQPDESREVCAPPLGPVGEPLRDLCRKNVEHHDPPMPA